MKNIRYLTKLGCPVMDGVGLLGALKQMGVRVNEIADKAMRDSKFQTARTAGNQIGDPQAVDLVVVEASSILPEYPDGTAGHALGNKDRNFRPVIAFAKELGFNVCTPECAPRFLLQHGANLKAGESFSLLMEGVNLPGYKVIFSLGRGEDGNLFLNGEFRSFFFPTNLPVLAVSN